MKRLLSILLSICLTFSIVNTYVFADDEIATGTKKYSINNQTYTVDWTYNFNTGVLTLSGEGSLSFKTENIAFYKTVNGLNMRDDEKTERFYNGCKTLVINGFSEINTINVGETVNLETIYLPKELVRMTSNHHDTPIGYYAVGVFQGKYKNGGYEKPQNLKAFIVDPENSAYKSIDGVLYTKNGAFLEYPYGKTDEIFTVPKDICPYNNEWGYINIQGPYLKKVIVPEDVGSFEFATSADLYLYSKSAYGYGNTTYMYKDSEAYKHACEYIDMGYHKKVTIINGKLDVSGTFGNNITWQYDEPSKTLTLLGNGALNDIENKDEGYPYFNFYFNEIENIILKKGISHIGSNNFYFYTNLKHITIPKSVTSIGYNAFFESSNVTDIYYEGTQSEWNNIDDESIANDLPNAKIHYNYNTNKNFENNTLSSSSYTYDGTEKSLTVSGDLPDGAKVTYTNNNQINAGTYKVTAKVTCEEYNDLTLSATLTIEKAPISVKANDIQVVKGASTPSLTYTITSGKLFGSDTLTGSLSTKATTSKTGNYDITQGTLKASSNYNLSFTKGTLSVVDKTPQNITVSTISDKTYGDSAFKLDIVPDIGSKLNDFTFVSSNTNVAEISTDGTVTIKAAGETDITVKQAGNDEYAPFENTQKLVVNKKTVTVKEINLNDKTALLEGVLEADSNSVALNFDTIMLDIINTDNESKITVNADNFVLSGEKALNYEVAGEKIETTVSPDNIVKIDVISKNGSVFGAANYLKGSIVTLEAHSNSGYRFGGWYIDNKSVSSSEKYTFNADTDITIEAKFAKKSSGGGGSNSKNSGSVTKPSNNTPQAETTEETTPSVKETSKKIVLKVGSKNTKVDDKDVINDVAPIIRNDRTMLPARFVLENLGAKVAWNEEEKKVTITRENTVIEIFIGWTKAYINGKETQLDSPAFIENDRTYTPVRFIAEALSAQVDWNEESNQVTITK